MKQCSYCGTAAADNVTVCPACGANQFSRICPNCGKAFESGSFCPNCGTNANSRPKTCPRCGNVYFTNACPNCGYNTLTSGQQAQPRPQNTYQQSTYQPSSQPEKKKVGCGKILLWICFFPIMAIIAVWKSDRLSTCLKIILTAAILGVFVAAGESSETTSSTSTGLDAPLITATSAPIEAIDGTETAEAVPSADAEATVVEAEDETPAEGIEQSVSSAFAG